MIFEHFQKISEDFPKMLRNNKNIRKTLLNRFLSFPKISEHSRRFPENFKNILDRFQSFPKISEDCQNFRKSFKLLKNGFEAFPKFFEISWRFPSSSENFRKFSEDLGMG